MGSVLPFIHLLSGESSLDAYPILPDIMQSVGIAEDQQKLAMGIIVVVCITLSNLFQMGVLWLRLRFAWGIAKGLSVRMLKGILRRPYAFFVEENSASIRSRILGEVQKLTSGVITPILDLVSRTVLILVIMTLLLFVSPSITLITLGIFGLAYGGFFMFIRKHVRQLGEKRIEKNKARYRILSELLGGIKTVKLFGVERQFHERFSNTSDAFFDIHPRMAILANSPKYIFEILAFGSIIILALILSGSNNSSAIPMLALFAVAGYRLMPSIQAAFAAITNIRHNWPILEKLHPELVKAMEVEPFNDHQSHPIIPFRNTLILDNIHFRYNEKTPLFNGLDLEIKKGSMISIMGVTGGGKTTLLDLITGLVKPDSGRILIDETPLNNQTANRWRDQIAYVTQDVFMFDDTILANIVLDVENDPNMERVLMVCRQARLMEFINDQKEGLDTIVGERGVRISGGQKQRIALARALYKEAEILILDEGTSALDNITEKNVIDELIHSYKDLTIIFVTHRIASLRKSDHIYVLEDGNLIAQGDYDTLQSENIDFRRYIVEST